MGERLGYSFHNLIPIEVDTIEVAPIEVVPTVSCAIAPVTTEVEVDRIWKKKASVDLFVHYSYIGKLGG